LLSLLIPYYGEHANQMSRITARDVEALIEVFESLDWQELRLEVQEFSIELSKRTGVRRVTEGSRSSLLAPPLTGAARSQAASEREIDKPGGPYTAKDSEIPPGSLAVRAPTMGTFYRAARPGAQPFVEVDSRVEPASELCLIEVMKLFTAVSAGIRGRIQEIRVNDGEPVEHDQILFLIEPLP
jgi:acetyl-CoA carboxylase biotin carboxyl carrier protein